MQVSLGLIFTLGFAIFAHSSTLKIGHINSLSGPEASFGEHTDKGIRLALKEINASGGIGGKSLELTTLDDQSRSDEAVTAMTKLAPRKEILAVIGESASTRSLAMAPIAQRYRLPMVSPSATNPKVTQVGNYIFRVCFIDPFQGPIVSKFAFDDLKLRRIAVLKDVRNDYSVGLANFFIDDFKKRGGTISSVESYSAGDVDFRAQLTAVRSKKPDALFLPGFYTDVGLIARQARELGIHQPLLGGDGWDSPSLIEIGKEAMNGSYFANHYSPDDTAPFVRQFIECFKKEYGVEPNSSSALGYDAARLVIDAMKRAQSLSREHLREAIAVTHDFPGVTGKITLNQERNAEKPAVMLKVENGKMRFHRSVVL